MKIIVEKLDDLRLEDMEGPCRQLTISRLQASADNGGKLLLKEEYLDKAVKAFIELSL